MAVYTHLTEDDIRAFLSGYDVGELVAFQGIAEGVSNSNFLIKTDRNRYILTLFEHRTNAEELPYFVGVMEHLAEHGFACPKPIADRAGKVLHTLKGKPAMMVSFLEGKSVRAIRNTHMALLGDALGRMHRAAEGFSMQRDNALSLAAWEQMADAVLPRADEIAPRLSEVIAKELQFLKSHWPDALPKGVIHADLFPDNVFFREQGADVHFGGMIDFYFACNDFFMYDLAVTMNAWCFESMHHEFNITRAGLLLKSYQQVRPFAAGELDALPILARGAAMRFLLTRSYDMLNPAEDAIVTAKDPKEYLRKLQFHQRIKSTGEYGV